MWQLNHQVGFDYNFSPQEYKRDNRFQFYDQPEITSYSAFYRMPLGGESSMRRGYDREPADFGYDEVTRQFRLLPATGNTELTFYGSRSVSDIPVRYGPVSVIFTNSLANISSESAQTSETINNNLGSRLTLPLEELAGIRSSLSFGADFKTYEAPSFSTNITYFSLYSLDNFGNQVLVTNQSLRLPSNTRVQLHYIPLTYSWNASRPDNWGSFAFNFSQSVFFSWLASARNDFEQAAAAPGAGRQLYYNQRGAGPRRATLGRLVSLAKHERPMGQRPAVQQTNSSPWEARAGVRGYREGEIYGDDGWRLMFDLRAPPVNIGYLPTHDGEMPAELRCSWFMDYGQAFLIDRPGLVDSAYTQWGTGLGFFLTVGEHVNARLTLAWALLNTPMTTAGSAQAYFSVGAQF